MKFSRWILSLAAAALLAPAVVPAQTTAPAPTINQRRVNQQHRIANGVRSGELTPGETRRLEGREAHINREIRRDRRANGGTLTRAERAKITRQQNRTSRAIYRAKHNNVRQ